MSMSDRDEPIVVLFAYARPAHLRLTLEALEANSVARMIVFSDGPRSAEDAPAVEKVRGLLESVDWCEIDLRKRQVNLGLGRSILSGVSEVLSCHDAIIVFEDDLVCVPGAIAYLSAALRHYRDDPRVMSVTGWTHPRVLPQGVADQPYFDGRAESWVWGAWRRSWQGMSRPAVELVDACLAAGVDVNRYGADLPAMARDELDLNIWAVRWIYSHLLEGGLCFRPPHSLVNHIGFDNQATNASEDTMWRDSSLQPCPPVPTVWPEPVEHASCPDLWCRAYPHQPMVRTLARLPVLVRRLRRRVVGALHRGTIR